MSRARGDSDENVLKRLTHYTDEHGLDTLTELWAQTSPESLPGVLYRVYLLRSMIMRTTGEMTALYELGRERLATTDQIVAGLDAPTNLREVEQFSEDVLRGVFHGDFHLSLNRAAAFCAIVAAGCLEHADRIDAEHPGTAAALTRRAGALTDMVQVFRRGAVLWARNVLN